MKKYVDDALVLEPGTLRHQAIIQAPAFIQTSSGADVPDWSNPAATYSCRVCFNSPRARKYFAADRETVEKLYPIEMWWQAGIAETMRFLFDGREFEIMTAVDVEERHRVLYLLVRELL